MPLHRCYMGMRSESMRDRVCPNGHVGKLRRSEDWVRVLGLVGQLSVVFVVLAVIAEKIFPSFSLVDEPAVATIPTLILLGDTFVFSILNEFLPKKYACSDCGAEVVDPRQPWSPAVKAVAVVGTAILALVGGLLVLMVLATVSPESLTWLSEMLGISV